MVLRESGSTTRRIFEIALQAAEVEVDIVLEIGSREGVHEAVVAGLGIGIVVASELGDDERIHTIETFLMPADPGFEFARFYDALSDRGFVIYPGKLTVADSFRIGCIGQVGPKQIHQALSVIESTLGELGVQSGAPATAS